jgi:hypothetical protein
MSWSKIFAVTAVFMFVFGIATIDCAVAGEKMKWHGATYTVKWEQIEVGDEEGHVVAVTESKQIYFDELTGERWAGQAVSMIDINLKTGQGFVQGYGSVTDKDGDKWFRKHEGKPVGKGHWKGTWSLVKGTGKHEGIKGGGTWDEYSLGPQESYLEIEGEFEIPAK